jgi:hypothetical protein
MNARAGKKESKVVGALAVIREVEAFEFGLLCCPEADGKVDQLVENRRAAPRPEKGE